ncbi:MAG: hypothetical protein AAGC55_05495, partial [Myxococcota bacterium]
MLICAACGDDGDDDGTGTDAGGPSTDASSANCLAIADHGTVTPAADDLAADSFGSTVAEDPDFLVLTVLLNNDPAPDAFLLELYKLPGGVFAGGIVPGTYQIAGAELQYADCSVCPRIFTDFNLAVDPPEPSDAGYLATGGTVQIDSVTPNFAGSVTGLTFQHVNIAEDGTFTSTPHPDGCGSSIQGITFDVANTFNLVPAQQLQGSDGYRSANGRIGTTVLSRSGPAAH